MAEALTSPKRPAPLSAASVGTDGDAAPILVMRGITKRFPGVMALINVDFDIRAGEVHALVGENGAGKSTLMKILGGAYEADGGEILLDGRPLALRSPRDAIAVGINVVYQELMLAPHLSAAENIFLGQRTIRRGPVISWKAMHDRAREIMEVLGVELDVNTPVRDLSVAQQQLVEIARALQRKSRILVLDEPSAVLGQNNMETLFGAIRRLQQQQVAVVYISHRLEEVFQVAERVTVLKDGSLVGTRSIAELDRDKLVSMMIGRQLSSVFPTRLHAPGEPVLRLEGLGRHGKFEDVSFEIRAGEIVGVAGLVGSGRTDVARAIFGADRPDSGAVMLYGERVRLRSPKEGLKRGVGLLPEDRKRQGLLLNRPVRENMTISSLREYASWGVLNVRSEESAVARLVSALNIRTPGLRQLVRNLSGGNQQKVVLARWLAAKCRLLVIDEPTRGVDVGAKLEIYRLMNELADGGTAILMISSEIPEVLGMSDRIIVMRNGRVVDTFTRAEATEEAVMQAALLGENTHGGN